MIPATTILLAALALALAFAAWAEVRDEKSRRNRGGVS